MQAAVPEPGTVSMKNWPPCSSMKALANARLSCRVSARSTGAGAPTGCSAAVTSDGVMPAPPSAVAAHPRCARAEVDRHALRLGARVDGAEAVRDDGIEVQVLFDQGGLAGPDPRQLQHVADEIAQMGC